MTTSAWIIPMAAGCVIFAAGAVLALVSVLVMVREIRAVAACNCSCNDYYYDGDDGDGDGDGDVPRDPEPDPTSASPLPRLAPGELDGLRAPGPGPGRVHLTRGEVDALLSSADPADRRLVDALREPLYGHADRCDCLSCRARLVANLLGTAPRDGSIR
jgi:hypothetical protein